MRPGNSNTDGWLPYPPDRADYATGLADVSRAAAAAGRGAGAVSPALFMSVLIADSAEAGRRALADYARASYGMPLEELEQIQALATGTASEAAGQLERYVDAGARHLVCRIGALDLTAISRQAEQLAELLPALRLRGRSGSAARSR